MPVSRKLAHIKKSCPWSSGRSYGKCVQVVIPKSMIHSLFADYLVTLVTLETLTVGRNRYFNLIIVK